MHGKTHTHANKSTTTINKCSPPEWCFIALTLLRAQIYNLLLCWHERAPVTQWTEYPNVEIAEKFSCWKLWTPCNADTYELRSMQHNIQRWPGHRSRRGDETTHCFHFDSYSFIIIRLLKWQINQHARKVMATLFLLICANKWNTPTDAIDHIRSKKS